MQSRYYHSEIGRFINADTFTATGQGLLGNNMFSYCTNNPTNFHDPKGRCKNTFSIYLKVDCKQVHCPTSEYYVKPAGTYKRGKGNVYIVTEEQLGNTTPKKNTVVIIDKRTSSDPDMQVLDSYQISKTKYQKEIAQIMLDYNEEHPVDPAWVRTLDSIVEEWKLHNLAYFFKYKPERTGDCDFNNKDEGAGIWDFIGR